MHLDILSFFAGILLASFFSPFLVKKFFVTKKNDFISESNYANNFGECQHLQPNDYANILADIEMGILVFNIQNTLIYANNTAIDMLGDSLHECSELDDFLGKFGTENGLMASYVLNKKEISAAYSANGRTFTICLHNDLALMHDFLLVSIYDITQRENLEIQRKLFVSNVSHELKTPLTTIISYTESLLDWGIKEQSQQQLIKDITRIHDDGIRMQKLVNNLSLLTSIDSRGIRPLMEELDLAYLVKYCVDALRLNAKEKDIILELFIAPNIPLVFAERVSVERILYNLIENAIKYTPRQGKIRVYLNYIHQEVYIKVLDNGVGIAKENLSLIFNRFYRVDNSGSSVLGGTGLGLAIAKELAELQNGRITVSSNGSSGSEFIFFLPTAYKVMNDALFYRLHEYNSLPMIIQLAQSFIIEQLPDLGISATLRELTDVQISDFIQQYSMPNNADSGYIAEMDGSINFDIKVDLMDNVKEKELFEEAERVEEISPNTSEIAITESIVQSEAERSEDKDESDADVVTLGCERDMQGKNDGKASQKSSKSPQLGNSKKEDSPDNGHEEKIRRVYSNHKKRSNHKNLSKDDRKKIADKDRDENSQKSAEKKE